MLINHNATKFLCILFLTGCNNSNVSQTQPVADSKQTSTSLVQSNTKENPAESQISVNSATPEVVPTPTATIAVKPSPEGKDQTASKSAPKTATASTVTPSQEQLKRWGHIPFEPLQLLGVRAWPKSGFATNLVALPKGQKFILAGTKVALWSLEKQEPEHVFLDLAQSEKNAIVLSISLSSDGERLAVGDSEGLLHIWDIASHDELVSKKIYSTGIVKVAFSPDSSEIATISYDNEVTIWDPKDASKLKRFKVDTNGVKNLMYIAPDQLAVAGETTSIWNTKSGVVEQKLSLGRYNFTLAGLHDKKRFIFGDKKGLTYWDIEQKQIGSIVQGSFATNELIDFSQDESLFATANGSTLRLWQSANQRVAQVIDTFGWPIVGVAWLPETKLLLCASENGYLRIWGTAADGLPHHMEPMQKPVALLAPASHEPVNPSQLEQVIDLRSFPQLPGTQAVGSDPFSLHYTSTVSIDEFAIFYRYFLQQAGWSEQKMDNAMAGMLSFRKGTAMLDVSGYDAGGGNISINVNCGGNFDLRWAPKFDAAPAQTVFENENTVMVKTKADLLTIETNLLRKMIENHWVLYTRLHAGHREDIDRRDLAFLKNGLSLQVSIAPLPAEPDTTMIQYSKKLMSRSLPVPSDCNYIEFEGSTEPLMVAMTSMNLDAAREFFDKELEAQSWIKIESGRILKEEYNWLPFLRSQSDLVIGLESQPDGRTMIKVGKDLKNSSWQMAKEVEAETSDPREPQSAISFESWLRKKRQEFTLKQLEVYEAEMRELSKK